MLCSQKRMNFTFNIPLDRTYPTSFMTSNGSLSYSLVAYIKRGYWKSLAWKVVNFKGFYNMTHLESGEFVDRKLVQDDKITSIFTVPSVTVVNGCNESLKATLRLNGLIKNRVNATLTFLRNINYRSNMQSQKIWSSTKQTEQKDDILFEWSFIVPSLSRASYVHHLYSVQYFLKVKCTEIDKFMTFSFNFIDF